MSKYTTSIRTLVKNNFDFGMKDYPIFNETYRNTLNQNILHYYYNYEIAFETAELFKFHLNTTLNIIMPKYNEMYNAYIQTKNKLLDNVNLIEELKRNNTSDITNNGNSNSTSSNTSKEIIQDTPQGKIYQDDIDNLKWASNATHNKNDVTDNSTTNSTSTGSATEKYTKNIIGNNGNKSNIQLLSDIEKNLKSIDLLIIYELDDLFFGLL